MKSTELAGENETLGVTTGLYMSNIDFQIQQVNAKNNLTQDKVLM